MKREYYGVTIKIEELCKRYNIKLETVWISRELREIEFCDT